MKGFGRRVFRLFAVLLAVLLLCSALSVTVCAYNTDYPNTWVNTGDQIEDLIGVAMSQVGYYGVEYRSGTKYGAWYGNTLAPWCGMFVSWCAAQANIPKSVILHSARANDFRLAGTYHYKDNYTPKRGDLVLYNPTDSSGNYYFPSKNADGTYSRNQHVAMVCSYDPSSNVIWIVHGNATGDKVCYNSISVAKMAIQSFVTPNYTSTSGGSAPASDYINGTDVRLRSAPAIASGNIVATLSLGEQVKVLDCVTDTDGDKWYHVTAVGRGVSGYVYGEYVTVVTPVEPSNETPSDTINGDAVRLRSAPTTNGSEILTSLNSGQIVTVLEVAHDSDGDKWYKVSLTKDGTPYTGYVFSAYVNLVSTEPTDNTPTDKNDTITDNATRLRDLAGYSGQLVTLLDAGQKVQIHDTVLDSDGDKWYHVTASVSGTEYTGYVFGELVSLGNPDEKVSFKYWLDTPDSGTDYDPYLEEQIEVRGWAFSDTGDTVCYLSVDGGTLTKLPAVSRPDVKAAYSDICQSENTGFSTKVDLTALDEGTHRIEIYASSRATVEKLMSASFNVGDFHGPEGADVTISEISSDGYTVSVRATDRSGMDKVEFPTWTESDGQDDLVWLASSAVKDSVYTCRIRTADFSVADDTYITHIYGTDTAGNKACIGWISLNPSRETVCTVIYDANGGTSAPEKQVSTYNGNVVLTMDKPLRDGYCFLGWTIDKDDQTATYYGGDTYTGNSVLSLYALWISADILPAGDCNGDGYIDVSDLAVLKKYLVGEEQPVLARADFNGDTYVDTSDLGQLKKNLAGLF